MKKLFIILLVLLTSGTTFAQKANALVGVWQQIVGGQANTLTIGPQGKVFMPDGRVFGFFLNPCQIDQYENFNFTPWMFANYEVTSDSTYTEKVFLHNDTGFETTINFNYRFINSRTLIAIFDHVYPDGKTQTIVDLWIKAVYDPEELKAILKRVSDNWDGYIKAAKEAYGRE